MWQTTFSASEGLISEESAGAVSDVSPEGIKSGMVGTRLGTRPMVAINETRRHWSPFVVNRASLHLHML